MHSVHFFLLGALAICACSDDDSVATGSAATTGSGASGPGGAGGTGGVGSPAGTGATGAGGIGGAGSTASAGGMGGGGGFAGAAGGGAGGSGGESAFAAQLEGTWIIGWSGGLDHYSWVRFAFLTPTQGTASVLDAKGPTLTPYFPCEGMGLFGSDPALAEVVVQLPAACGMDATLTFDAFMPPPGFPPSAILAANVTHRGFGDISGYKFDDAICDPGFTTCGDPFQ